MKKTFDLRDTRDQESERDYKEKCFKRKFGDSNDVWRKEEGLILNRNMSNALLVLQVSLKPLNSQDLMKKFLRCSRAG